MYSTFNTMLCALANLYKISHLKHLGLPYDENRERELRGVIAMDPEGSDTLFRFDVGVCKVHSIPVYTKEMLTFDLLMDNKFRLSGSSVDPIMRRIIWKYTELSMTERGVCEDLTRSINKMMDNAYRMGAVRMEHLQPDASPSVIAKSLIPFSDGKSSRSILSDLTERGCETVESRLLLVYAAKTVIENFDVRINKFNNHHLDVVRHHLIKNGAKTLRASFTPTPFTAHSVFNAMFDHSIPCAATHLVNASRHLRVLALACGIMHHVALTKADTRTILDIRDLFMDREEFHFSKRCLKVADILSKGRPGVDFAPFLTAVLSRERFDKVQTCLKEFWFFIMHTGTVPKDRVYFYEVQWPFMPWITVEALHMHKVETTLRAVFEK